MLLINIEIFNKVFINKKFIKFYKLSIILLQNSIKLRLINNKFASNIIYIAQIIINLSEYIRLIVRVGFSPKSITRPESYT